MQLKSVWRTALLVGVVAAGLISVSEAGPAPQQDVIRLEQRMNQLEQRLFSMENNLRNIEQQSRIGSSSVRGFNPEDVARLRLEVQALTNRLAEHECALQKLDERTLSAAMKTARRKSAAANDACRQNADTPVQLR